MAIEAIATTDEIMTPTEVAKLLRVGLPTLAAWRCYGRTKLSFIRLGNKAIRYRRSDVMAFLERNSATTTAELDAAALA